MLGEGASLGSTFLRQLIAGINILVSKSTFMNDIKVNMNCVK